MKPPRPDQRFRDRREHLCDFAEEYLVVCPRCHGCGTVRNTDPSRTECFAPRRFICRNCGLSKEWAGTTIGRHGPEPQDDYFNLPLWLQVSCCGETLWAHNARHLQFIRDYVGATIRERQRDTTHGWNNGGLASRLPRWMQLAKNRPDILKAIAKLELKLVDWERAKRP